MILYSKRVHHHLISKENFDDKFYNHFFWDLKTNSTGKQAELCQLAAIDRFHKQFSCYILTNKDIDPASCI